MAAIVLVSLFMIQGNTHACHRHWVLMLLVGWVRELLHLAIL